MYRMYVLTLRDGVKFNLVYIPDERRERVQRNVRRGLHEQAV